ncbi:MAG: GNAT family N-acetyltransferase [Pseudomonadota bacterium]
MNAEIRLALEEDAQTLALLGAETFIATFGHLYGEKDLNYFLEKNHTAGAYAALLRDPEYGLWLAVSPSGEAIGYAVAGPCSLPVPDCPANAGELSRLYLKKGVQGGGIGAKLLEAALDFLRDRFDHIYLSVYAENAVAQRLYHRFGFVKIHDYFYMVGDHSDPEWIMELKDQ